MTHCCDWRALPFEEIWAVDTEFYPGPGRAHGGREGDQITPLALVAIELRSGRTVRLWQDELSPFPPYRLDPQALIVAYMATAEFGFHLSAGWGQPARSLDLYIEFRRLTNIARGKRRSRASYQAENFEDEEIKQPAGFYSLAGALRYLGEDEIDVTRKDEMRDRILDGPPFSAAERAEILLYCEDDTRALARLIPRLVPTIPSLAHALFRAEYAWALAQQERRGVPIDLAQFNRLQARWGDIKTELVATVDREYGCYEIVDGVPHFREELFRAYLWRQRIAWPTHAGGGRLKLKAGTFRDMAQAHPQLAQMHELRGTLAQLRNNRLAIGRDGRNRTLLGPFGTKTGRNAPSNSKYIFGPAKCLRFLIMPAPGTALIHRDFSQQEVWIAAIRSGDEALLTACQSGDVYLGIAAQLGFETRPGLRALFKIVVLSILYGASAPSLAARTGISPYEAREILARLRARFRRFEEWCGNVEDRAGLRLMLSTGLGWTIRCEPGCNPRSIRNWPIQSDGAAILHVACVLAERRGLHLVAPVHDALVAEAPAAGAAEASLALDRLMRDASAVVLSGHELPTGDPQALLPGQHYYDERGAMMWAVITRLIDGLERRQV